jgi:hypothetical protein
VIRMTSFLVQKTTERLEALALGRARERICKSLGAREGAHLLENVQRNCIRRRVAYA